MVFRNVKMIDHCRDVVATAQVAERGDGFAGLIDLSQMPAELRRKFEEYEEIVNGQIFSLLDEIEEQIGAIPLKVVFEEGAEASVADLQIYPGIGRV
ncbi:MAG: hypothetical protein ACREEM_52020, partial [Blastocatellia bacterium]